MTAFYTSAPDALPSAAPAARPVVLIDGVPELGLAAIDYRADAPLDERRAQIAVVDPALWARRSELLHRRADMALAHALSDDASRWEVLVGGRLHVTERSRRPGADDRTLELIDDWSARLARPVGAGWAVTTDGLQADEAARLNVSGRANRSRERFMIHGRSVYTIEPGGEAWTLGDALDAVAAFAQIDLASDLLPASEREKRLSSTLSLSSTLGGVLRQLLEEAGWMIRSESWRVGGQMGRALAVVPGGSGRRFALPWDGGGGSRVGRVTVEQRHDPPRRWVMRGGRPVVEATLDLVPGWDPALGGLADAQYGKTTSSNFSRYGSVYRHWVLNEDGALVRPPFSQSPAFDLRGLFRDARLTAEPTPIGDCLVQDAAGRRLAPVVEVSMDAGVSWSRYGGEASVMRGRAGVVLADAVLEPGLLSSAKAGQLRVRVTGTLRSPRALEVSRWRGNPFAGAAAERVIERGDAYRYARVDSTSIHADALDLGELEAEEADDRRALEAALLGLMNHESERGVASGHVDLIGAWPTLCVGDRLLDLGGPGVGASGVPTSVVAEAARVASVRVRFGVGGKGPMTRLVLDDAAAG